MHLARHAEAGDRGGAGAQPAGEIAKGAGGQGAQGGQVQLGAAGAAAAGRALLGRVTVASAAPEEAPSATAEMVVVPRSSPR